MALKKQQEPMPADVAERMEENATNMPLTSMVLAGVLGAGLIALLSFMIPKSKYTEI